MTFRTDSDSKKFGKTYNKKLITRPPEDFVSSTDGLTYGITNGKAFILASFPGNKHIEDWANANALFFEGMAKRLRVFAERVREGETVSYGMGDIK